MDQVKGNDSVCPSVTIYVPGPGLLSHPEMVLVPDTREARKKNANASKIIMILK